KIRIPLSVVRSVPEHYTWFMLEGTPPIQAWLANSSTPLEGGPVVKRLKFVQTGNYTILAKSDAGNSSKKVDVNKRCIDFADCTHLCQSKGLLNGSGQVTNHHDCSGGNATYIWKCIPTTTTNL
ncbi:unnamed protein product, partial [Porites lobata]